jgi:hypothetical protein
MPERYKVSEAEKNVDPDLRNKDTSGSGEFEFN